MVRKVFRSLTYLLQKIVFKNCCFSTFSCHYGEIRSRMVCSLSFTWSPFAFVFTHGDDRFFKIRLIVAQQSSEDATVVKVVRG